MDERQLESWLFYEYLTYADITFMSPCHENDHLSHWTDSIIIRSCALLVYEYLTPF